MIKIDLIGGARPNFIKLGPIYREIKKRGIFKPRFVYTGQHVAKIMTADNWNVIGLDSPDLILCNVCHSGNGIGCIPSVIEEYSRVLQDDKPDLALVVGDTDSSLGATIAAKRNNIPVIHVEAGLRGISDEPEEYNRKMIDSISDLLLAPTWDAMSRLRRRGFDNIKFVGNLIADGLIFLLTQKEWILLPSYSTDILATFHRPYNVDNEIRLKLIIDQFDALSDRGFSIYFSVHPRTQNMLEQLGISDRSYFHETLSYLQFTKMLSNSKVVITDSGGVQIEAVFFGTPCIAAMKRSGWPELVDLKMIELCPDLDFLSTVRHVIHNRIVDTKRIKSIDGMQGNAARNIHDSIVEFGKIDVIQNCVHR